MIVTADKGVFLLKRGPAAGMTSNASPSLTRSSSTLATRSFPVTSLLETADEHTTALSLQNHIYEFFRFVAGTRYDGSAEATREAGRQLACFISTWPTSRPPREVDLVLSRFRLVRAPRADQFR